MTKTFTSVFFIALVILAAFAVMVAQSATIEQTIAPGIEDLFDLPLTDHARNGHLDQAWTAGRIIGVMTGGGCHPVIVFVCRDEIRYFCPDPGKSNNYLGLIVGKENPIVITGWTARVRYWMSAVARDGCIPAALP